MRARALTLVRQHGWNATSFQLVGPDIRHFFSADGDAFVGYHDTGTAWVAGGAPVAAPERLATVADEFSAAANAAGRRAFFFPVGARFTEATGYPSVRLGEQPVWEPTRWEERVSGSLRSQLRRAAKKGVKVRALQAEEVAEGAPMRAALEALIQGWLRRKPMAPMGFLVEVAPFAHPEERLLFVAERDSRVVGFLAAAPIFARNGWLFTDLLRSEDAPNGTAELLVDAGMRAAAARGAAVVTLGMAPLSGPLPPGLAWVRALCRPLYDFRGLHAFKRRLRPHAWEPLALAVPPGQWAWVGVLEVLRAFARGSLLRFGTTTLARYVGRAGQRARGRLRGRPITKLFVDGELRKL